MKTFKAGTRVVRTETGEKGTVRTQFIDGYVSLEFDDGRPAELDAASLEEIKSPRTRAKLKSATSS